MKCIKLSYVYFQTFIRNLRIFHTYENAHTIVIYLLFNNLFIQLINFIQQTLAVSGVLGEVFERVACREAKTEKGSRC